MEETKEVKTFRINYICDDCGKGHMHFTGMQKMCNPPLNEHSCTNCGKKKEFSGKKYPRTFVRDI